MGAAVRGGYMPAERVLFKQAKSVAFSENLEELKEFLLNPEPCSDRPH
jgi:hypothetical protein